MKSMTDNTLRLFLSALFLTATAQSLCATVVDNGDLGYSVTGAWTTEFVGYAGDEQYQNDHSNITDTATWDFTGVPNGSYFVNSTWFVGGNRSISVPYTVTDGGTGLSANQQSPHLITSDLETGTYDAWTNITSAPVSVTDGTFSVTAGPDLQVGATNFMMADAVRIVGYKVSSNEYVVDDLLGAGNGFSTTGAWTTETASTYLGDELYQSAPDNTATATWTFTGLPSGLYQVSTTWFPLFNRTASAQFSLSDSGGNTFVDQQLAPNDYTSLGVNWESLHAGLLITDGTFTVTASDLDASLFLMADAVRLQLVPEPGSLTLLLFGGAFLWLFKGRRK